MTSAGPHEEAGTVIILGVEYRIVEGEDMESKGKDGTNGIRGAVNPYFNTIVLDEALGQSQKELTLLHECIHAVDDALDVGINEHQTRLLGAGLYGLQYKGPKKRDAWRTMRGVFYG